jgi:tetraacyldisaccharide 4'-kinase
MSQNAKLEIWGRKTLDAAWTQKGVLFWLLSPFLIFVSFCWFVVTSRKIQQRRLIKVPDYPRILCIGNVLVGGTGKSPILRALAIRLLEKGHDVCIFTKQLKKSVAKDVLWNSEKLQEQHWKELGDESLEHLLLLLPIAQKYGRKLFLVESTERGKSLEIFSSYAHQCGYSLKEIVCLVDDGLQSNKFSSHLEICVWDPDLVFTSPPFSIPIGPYREGFGAGFSRILNRHSIRLWSRCQESPGQLEKFYAKIKKALHRFGLVFQQGRDFPVTYDFKAARLDGFEPATCTLNVSPLDVDALKLWNTTGWMVVTGIARPERLLKDLERMRKGCTQEMNIVLMGDHAPLTDEVLQQMHLAKGVVLTLKDLARFLTDSRFESLLHSKPVHVCQIAVSISTWETFEELVWKGNL